MTSHVKYLYPIFTGLRSSEVNDERSWTLGLQSHANPQEIMSGVFKALQNLKACRKIIGLYNIKCRWVQNFGNNKNNQMNVGTFGWSPGKCSEDKPVKPLFLLKLSYEESQDHCERLLIGTKLLESAHYPIHRNGSAMLVVKIDSPSFEMFPFDTNGEDFEHSYAGEGLAKDSDFQYHVTYEPGSLFVTSEGLLVFVWKETRVVLTLQRANLGELFRKGICMCPLPPCLHFAPAFKPDRAV